jgi:hypothetical protein
MVLSVGVSIVAGVQDNIRFDLAVNTVAQTADLQESSGKSSAAKTVETFTRTGKMLSAETLLYLRIDLFGTTLTIRSCVIVMSVRSKTSPLVGSSALKKCSVCQIRLPRTAMTNKAHAHTNQTVMFKASFPRYACRTSMRFVRSDQQKNGSGTRNIRIQQRATHCLRAEASLITSAVSPSWILPPSASLPSRPSRPHLGTYCAAARATRWRSWMCHRAGS